MITSGLTVVLSNEVVDAEPIEISEVKDFLNITFDAHDAKISRLISACRSSLEQFKNVTLITSRNVTLSWQTFSDYEALLYYPVEITEENPLSVTDLSGVAYGSDSYEVLNVAGRVIIKGEFANGVKVTYKAVSLEINNSIKENLLRAVQMAFEQEVTPREAVKTVFKYVEI